MGTLQLYPKVIVQKQSFVGVKKHVVPMQSMSLKEIIRRFIKRESLPVSREGIYEDRYDYDLEKLQHEDLTVKEDVLKEFREKVKTLDIEVKKQKAQQQDAMKKVQADQRAKLLEELKSLNPQTEKE